MPALDPNDKTVNTANRFTDVAQKCDRTVLRAIMVHSSYDMSLKQIADTMTHKGTFLLLGSFIYTPEILTNKTDTGHIPVLDAHYVIDKNNDRIRFSFVGDASFNYSYRLDTYLAIGLSSLRKTRRWG